MADALQNPAADPVYLDYFGLDQAPFARLPNPESICDVEQYSLLMGRLADAKAATDHLVVLRGIDGSGKTTLLNRFLVTLEDGDSYACIDDNCRSAAGFYCSFLEQIGFKNIEGKLAELKSITREFLIHRSVVNDAVLLVIDNAQRIHPEVFEQLSWLANIRHDDRRVFSAVLAGNSNLGHILNSPAMAGLKFEVCVDFHIRAFSEDETADYMRHRMMLAGAIDKVSFTPEALALIHRFSSGIPRWINRIGNLLLTAASEREIHDIDDALVRSVAEAEQLPANVFPLKNRGRRKTDSKEALPPVDQPGQEQIQQRQAGAAYAHRERIAASPVPDVDIARLFDQIAELSAQIGKLKADKATADQDVETRNLDISKLQDLLAQKDASLDQGMLDLQQLRESLEEQEKSTSTAQSEALRALQRIEKLEKTKAKLEEATAELRSDLESATEKAANLARIENQLEETEQENASLRASVEELEELRGSLADRDASIASLRAGMEELEELRDSIADRDASIETLRANVEELEELRGNIADRDASIASLRAGMEELEELRDSIADRDASIASLKEELANLVASNTNTQPRLAEIAGDTWENVDVSGDESSTAIVAMEVMRHGRIEQVFDLRTGSGRFMIGREMDSELQLDSSFVSRHHALIFSQPSGTYIEDLNSFNGTIVNGRTVSRSELKPDDSIIIGEYLLRPISGQ